MTDVRDFQEHVAETILDPHGVHQEFVSGMHGRKLDFDEIDDGSELYDEWIDVTVDAFWDLYPDAQLDRTALVGTANGANRHARSTAERLGGKALGLETEKISAKQVDLTEDAREKLLIAQPKLIVVTEDAGTAGTTTATAVEAVHGLELASDPRIEVLNTWQRRLTLEKLVAIGAVYNSIIYQPLPTFHPEACRRARYCHWGWQLIEHAA